VRHGVDIKRLQQVLGHSSLNIKAIYLQFMIRMCRKCMQTCSSSNGTLDWRFY
jgi:site-specific recombinase XerD